MQSALVPGRQAPAQTGVKLARSRTRNPPRPQSPAAGHTRGVGTQPIASPDRLQPPQSDRPGRQLEPQ